MSKKRVNELIDEKLDNMGIVLKETNKRSQQTVAFLLGTMPKATLDKKVNWRNMPYLTLFPLTLIYEYNDDGTMKKTKKGEPVYRDVTLRELLSYIDP